MESIFGRLSGHALSEDCLLEEDSWWLEGELERFTEEGDGLFTRSGLSWRSCGTAFPVVEWLFNRSTSFFYERNDKRE